ARKGILTQTRRHTFIVSMLGVKNIVLAVNKMDLVDHREQTFQLIFDDYKHLATTLNLKNIIGIPLSALNGDNVVTRSERTPWYTGPCLLDYLETISCEKQDNSLLFRVPVQ